MSDRQPYTLDQLVEQLGRIAAALERIADQLQDWDHELGAIRTEWVE